MVRSKIPKDRVKSNPKSGSKNACVTGPATGEVISKTADKLVSHWLQPYIKNFLTGATSSHVMLFPTTGVSFYPHEESWYPNPVVTYQSLLAFP